MESLTLRVDIDDIENVDEAEVAKLFSEAAIYAIRDKRGQVTPAAAARAKWTDAGIL